jgi:SET domain-containing protein
MRKPYLYLAATTNNGRGVFTNKKIPANTVIEIAPVIVMEQKDREYLDKTLLHDYIFEWGPNSDKCCMALGWIPMYNHCYQSNCEYFMDFDAATIFIKTVGIIKAAQELTINYNGDWNNEEKVWFEVND